MFEHLLRFLGYIDNALHIYFVYIRPVQLILMQSLVLLDRYILLAHEMSEQLNFDSVKLPSFVRMQYFDMLLKRVL